jgi:type II secretory pathway pseudopilin PulG
MKALQSIATQSLARRLALAARLPKIRERSSMKFGARQIAGFSLVEVALALGVAALCLLVLMGLLPIGIRTQQSAAQQTTANQIISAIYAVLSADVRLPPGLANKVCPDPPDPNLPCNWGALHGNWLRRAAPDTIYFTNDGTQTGNIGPNATPPPDAVFRAKIIYRLPPSETTSLADITVSWPAAVDPANGGVPAGSAMTTITVNR